MSEGGGRSDPVVDVAPLTATMSQLSTSGSNNSQAFGGLVTHFAKGEETSSTDAHFQVPLPFTVTGTQHGLSKFNNNTHNKFQRQRSKSLTHQQYHHQGSSQQKTTMHHLQDGSTPPHKPSGSSGSSGSYVAKPSPSAFHSTGVLSKKGRGGGLYGLGGGGNGGEGSKITPETPIKHKRVLGSIWSGLDGPTNAASMLKPGPISGGSSKSVHYGSGGGGIDCQPPQDTPLKRSTPASLLPPYLSNNSHRNTPHLHPTSTSTSSFSALGKPPQIPGSFSSSKFLVSPVDLRINKIEATTPSVASAASTKSSRLHRSPLKETPTKLFKRPHLEQNEKDGKYSLDLHSQNQQHGISQENMHPFLFSNDRNITIDETANLPAQQSTSIQNVSGMDIVIDEEGEAPLESSGGLPSSLQNPMQPPSTIEQQQQDLNPSSISAATQPSPVIPAKLFFSRIVKERKNVPAPSLAPSIPFTALISRYRHSIDQVFFDAADGVQPGLNLTLSMFARRGGSGIDSLAIPDWFESRFELIGRLGQGEFADAFHVLSLDDGIEYAIKKTRHPFIGYKDAIQKLNEVRMLLQVKASPYCVSLKDAWIQFGYIYIQTEICKRGSLATYLEEHCAETPVTEDQIWRILADLSQGLYHIHQKGIVHLDLKPGNIFISQNGTLKIGDFGLACRPPVLNGDVEGDRTYLAPEFLTSSTVSFPADIYSLGLILLEMAANIILPQNGLVWQQLREGRINGIGLQRHSQMLVDFIQSMLHSSPSQRPTIGDLLKHPKLASQIQ